VTDIGPGQVTIAGVEYKLGGKNVLSFETLLSLCNASGASQALTPWRSAQNAVAAAAAAQAASAIGWGSRIASAKTDQERKELAAQAATEAARFAAELVTLNATAKAQRDAFMFALLATSTSAAVPAP
jgi:hypothetical protein